MARIRSVHPGLFTDESFMELTVEAPLAIPLLLGLWAEADDNGIFEWKPLTLKARILPAVPAEVGALMMLLEQKRFVIAYEIDGRKYGAIRNFTLWQRPKSPTFKHPVTDEIRKWIGLKEDHSPADGEELPKDFPTPTENRPQRKEEGGRKKEEQETRERRVVGLDFERWYSGYPNKVGRGDAEKAFAVVVRDTPVDEMIAGLKRYIASKPPDRPWCNPATWLRQRRWTDEPALPLSAQPKRQAITPLGVGG